MARGFSPRADDLWVRIETKPRPSATAAVSATDSSYSLWTDFSESRCSFCFPGMAKPFGPFLQLPKQLQEMISKGRSFSSSSFLISFLPLNGEPLTSFFFGLSHFLQMYNLFTLTNYAGSFVPSRRSRDFPVDWLFLPG